MAFSATQWRDVLSNYSGSQAGTRSWSVLGQSQYQGKHYVSVGKEYAGYGNAYKFTLKHFRCGAPKATGASKPVLSFYMIRSYLERYYTSYNAFFTPTNTQSFAAPSYYIYSTPCCQHNLGTLTTVSDINTTGPGYGQFRIWTPGDVRSLNSSNFVAFYNYSPWGNGPYSGGSNVAIGRGDSGSPSSGYPYQRNYNNIGTNFCP